MKHFLFFFILTMAFLPYSEGDSLNRKPFGFLIEDAQNGDREAQFELAQIYDRSFKSAKYDYGLNLENIGTRNIEKAFYWFKKAAEQGHTEAQYKVGVGYRFADYGVSKNPKEATKWLKKASDKGHILSQYQLSGIYDSFDGSGKDYLKAFALYKKLAGMNFKNIKNISPETLKFIAEHSQMRIVYMYELKSVSSSKKISPSKRIPITKVDAYKWNLVYQSFNEDVDRSSFLKEIGKEMSPSQIKKAKKRSEKIIKHLKDVFKKAESQKLKINI